MVYICGGSNKELTRRAEATYRNAQKGLKHRAVAKKIAAKKIYKKEKTLTGKEKKRKYQIMRSMKFTEKGWGLGDPSTFQHVHLAYIACDEEYGELDIDFFRDDDYWSFDKVYMD